MKWADCTEKNWENEFTSNEFPEPEAGSEEAPKDDDYSVPGEDEILEA